MLIKSPLKKWLICCPVRAAVSSNKLHFLSPFSSLISVGSISYNFIINLSVCELFIVAFSAAIVAAVLNETAATEVEAGTETDMTATARRKPTVIEDEATTPTGDDKTTATVTTSEELNKANGPITNNNMTDRMAITSHLLLWKSPMFQTGSRQKE